MKSVMFAVVLVLSVTISHAMTIIDTSTNWQGCSMGTFGHNGIFGQSFYVGQVDTKLDYFAVYVADNVNPAYMTFQFHLMEWSVSSLRAVGPILYSSDFVSSTNNHGNDGWEKIVFSTNGIQLGSRKDYIAIVTIPSNVNGTCWLGYASDVYCGEFAYTSGNINQFDSLSWTTDYPGHNGDLVCEIGLNVPEPATLLLLGLGAMMLRRKN